MQSLGGGESPGERIFVFLKDKSSEPRLPWKSCSSGALLGCWTGRISHPMIYGGAEPPPGTARRFSDICRPKKRSARMLALEEGVVKYFLFQTNLLFPPQPQCGAWLCSSPSRAQNQPPAAEICLASVGFKHCLVPSEPR